MKSTFSFLGVFFILFSCQIEEKETNLNIPFISNKLIVHGLIVNADSVFVNVQKSVPSGCRTCNDTLPGLKIELMENNLSLYELSTFNGVTFFSKKRLLFSTKNTYWVKINFNGTVIKSTFEPICSLVRIDTAFIDTTSRARKLKYCIVDTDQMTSYYIVKEEWVITKSDDNTVDSGGSSVFNYHNIIVKNAGSPQKFYGEKTVYSLPDDSLKCRLKVYKLSNTFYLFLKSIYENESTEADVYCERPTPVFTNITGGYGVFASYSFDSVEILK